MNQLGACMLLVAFVGCGGESTAKQAVRWTVRYATPDLEVMTRVLELSVYQQTCRGLLVQKEVVRAGNSPPSTTRILDPGTYCFEALAIEAGCFAVGSAQVLLALPAETPAVELAVQPLSPPVTTCGPMACMDGTCGAIQPMDAGPRDGARPDAPQEADAALDDAGSTTDALAPDAAEPDATSAIDAAPGA